MLWWIVSYAAGAIFTAGVFFAVAVENEDKHPGGTALAGGLFWPFTLIFMLGVLLGASKK